MYNATMVAKGARNKKQPDKKKSSQNIRTFVIPEDADERYPIKDCESGQLTTDSWYNLNGTDITWHEVPGDKKILRCKQIIVKPNLKQREILMEWFALYKYTYNQTVSYIRLNGIKSFKTLRPIIKDAFNQEIKDRILACKIPVHTIDNAVKDVTKAYKSSFALHKGKKKFRIRYKKEGATHTLVLEQSAFSKVKNSFSQHVGIIDTDTPMGKPNHDCRLSCRNGTIMLYAPIDKPTTECYQSERVCSLDPGLRTFQTVYCKSGDVYEFGTNVSNKLNPLFDKLEKPNTKAAFKKRIRAKIAHLVEDLHWKSASLLCKLSKKILIGNMSTVGVLQGNLHPRVKLLLQSLSHYTFRQRLKAKCEELGVEFAEVDESYTSKTCGSCGEINENLGAKKVFECKCGFKIDRDVNGARNIMIKNL